MALDSDFLSCSFSGDNFSASFLTVPSPELDELLVETYLRWLVRAWDQRNVGSLEECMIDITYGFFRGRLSVHSLTNVA